MSVKTNWSKLTGKAYTATTWGNNLTFPSTTWVEKIIAPATIWAEVLEQFSYWADGNAYWEDINNNWEGL